MIDPKECFKYHPTLHLVTGLGLGFLLAALVPSLASVVLGLVLVAVSVVAHFVDLGKMTGGSNATKTQ